MTTRRDSDPIIAGPQCGRSISTTGVGFVCTIEGPHDQHIYRGPAKASRGLGYADHLATEVTVMWQDSRPPATVGDLMRLMSECSEDL